MGTNRPIFKLAFFFPLEKRAIWDLPALTQPPATCSLSFAVTIFLALIWYHLSRLHPELPWLWRWASGSCYRADIRVGRSQARKFSFADFQVAVYCLWLTLGVEDSKKLGGSWGIFLGACWKAHTFHCTPKLIRALGSPGLFPSHDIAQWVLNPCFFKDRVRAASQSVGCIHGGL